MCSNYLPVTNADRLLRYFGVSREASEPPHDVFPMQRAPFIRQARPGETADGAHLVADAIFRFVPDFVAKVDWARKTYNARSETVDRKPTYRDAWRDGQRCIIPAEAIYEPNYESGSAVRWRIAKASGLPMGIAGIYTSWTSSEGQEVFAMSMLTVNADDHPFMSRFHAPGHEKRMVVILSQQTSAIGSAAPSPKRAHGIASSGMASWKVRPCHCRKRPCHSSRHRSDDPKVPRV